MILRFFDSAHVTTSRIFSTATFCAISLIGPAAFGQEEKDPAEAQSQLTEATESVEKKIPEEDANPFSASVDLKLRSSTKSSKDNDYRIFLTGGGSLSYDFKDIGSVGFSIHGNKDLNNEYRWSLTETTVDFSRSFDLLPGEGEGKGLKLGLGVSYGAPVSKDLIKYSNSKGDLGASAGLSYAFGGSLEGLRLSYGLSYSRYLYQYSDSNGGQILTKWAFEQNYGFSYKVKAVTVSASFTNTTSYDFHHNKEDDSFLHVETLAYAIDDHWNVSAGHINDGNTFDYGGAANNVRFYDKYRSQVFVGGSYSF